jgi:hypothetical protein
MQWMERLAEQRIREAQRAGAFDDVPGKGRPLPPDPFADLPPGPRIAARVLHNAGCVPEPVALLSRLDRARTRLAEARTPEEETRAMREHCEAELACNMSIERVRRMAG